MGPLHGMRVVELAGIGPGPLCAMLLADMGAEVVRVERREAVELGTARPPQFDLTARGRHLVHADLKNAAERGQVLELIAQADALVEGFRPGVMERLGLGPDICLARNRRLVYGRMTGWGQEGPLAQAAGHDLNYIAITGALDAIGRTGSPPTPPLNLVGDYGGGALYLAFGIACALAEVSHSGEGQVVDAAIVDGTASLLTTFFGLQAAGMHKEKRGHNVLDSGAYYYDVYQCSDGGWMSVAPLESRFRQELLERLGLQDRADATPEDMRAAFTEVFATKTRDEWTRLLEGTDACVAPVLSMQEAPHHPHLRARGTFVDIAGIVQPAPAPRFSRTVPAKPTPPWSSVKTLSQAVSEWTNRASCAR